MTLNKILIPLGVTSLLIGGAYLYAIQGEKLKSQDAEWLSTTPIAHRGFDNYAPENSMEAFKQAMDLGYAIELDVVATKDKELIVFHDTNLKRLTGLDKDVLDLNYDEIKTLTLKGSEETIPRLKDVLDLVDNKVPILVEIKTAENAIELAELTYDIMKDYKGRYAIQSFNPFILEWFKNTGPEVVRCQLACDFDEEDSEGLKWYEKFVLTNMLTNFKSRPHAIAYDLSSIDKPSVQLLRKSYPVISWTITDEKSKNKAYKYSDNIIFDKIEP